MAHPFSNRPSFVGMDAHLFGFGDGVPLGDEEDASVNRFCAEYRPSVNGASVWSDYASMQAATFDVLALGSRRERDEVYRHLYATPVTHGFAQGDVVFASLSSSEAARMHVGSIVLDRFYRLCEAVGAATLKSPEHGQTTIDVEGLDELFARMEKIIGFDVTPPAQAGDLFGVRFTRGIFSDRHFDAIYVAWRARELLINHRLPLHSVVEIGGGAGHLAYYLNKAGFRQIRIVDLPQAMLAQYILLSSALGAGAVSLNGFRETATVELIAAGPHSLDSTDSPIVINVDSLPEMPASDALQYLSAIPPDAFFLSINQESGIPNGSNPQSIVSVLTRRVGLERIYRHPAWLRTGYVEELYKRIG